MARFDSRRYTGFPPCFPVGQHKSAQPALIKVGSMKNDQKVEYLGNPNVLIKMKHCLYTGLGIGIKKSNAGISIPASRILVWYRTTKMPDCVSLVRYRTYSDIVSFFQSGTGLTGCRMVRHFYIYEHGH
jgi:hypothetical protein